MGRVRRAPGTAALREATPTVSQSRDPVEHGSFFPAAAGAIELVSVVLMVLGSLLACGVFAKRLLSGGAFPEAYHALRLDLGRAMLLGLELLVLADIIGTVVPAPSVENLGVLALIVVIRTLLSAMLEMEVHGRWPWQRARQSGE
jgi:uncharacterized membrane protein